MSTTRIELNSIVHRAFDLPFTQLDDERLAIDEPGGYVYSMNETASRVWDMLEQPCAVGAVCSSLRQEFAVDEVTCQREVLQLLQALHEAGLIQVDD